MSTLSVACADAVNNNARTSDFSITVKSFIAATPCGLDWNAGIPAGQTSVPRHMNTAYPARLHPAAGKPPDSL
jgi:hypothetical protein